ncbi:UNVERIFIED_CONTAM: hypothetical protein HHA_290610 [Hammondia hammondi]|eukprot:XP_008889197.1 hypothetical protein HHA_290610 [Hammondia hammondi]
MKSVLLLPLSLWVVSARAHAAIPLNIGEPCSRGHRGILFRVTDPTDFSQGCQVTAVLKKDCLQLFRGNKETARIALDAIETPVHIVPYHKTCLSIKPASRDAEILCCDNENCRDAWWMALSEQILCLHKGAMRNEVSGEPTVEEEEREVLEQVVEKPSEGGVTIHIEKSPEGVEPVLTVHPSFKQSDVHPH